MQISVIGLGIEGKKAITSLKSRKYDIYASDLNKNIDLTDNDIDIDIGFHDFRKIENSDAIILSPSLWNVKKFERFKLENKLLSDVLKKHKNIYTIAVTGTNGKTTTTNMIYNILKKNGMNVLVGGNAGGGFDGYNELILECQDNDYDILLIEVCDMTLEYCDYSFNIDLVVLTNIEEDHMDVHKTMDNYYQKVINFIGNKTAVINEEYKTLLSLENENINYYTKYDKILSLDGEFNKFNACAAYTTCKLLNINSDLIKKTLLDFKGVEGRSKYYTINNCELFVGKTDNKHATKVALSERYFEVVFLGTPRENEIWRLDLFKEAINAKPKIIIIFPGLSNNVDNVYKKVLNINNNIKIIKVKEFNNLWDLIKKMIYTSKTIFIGGNGQDKLIKIQKMLDNYIINEA